MRFWIQIARGSASINILDPKARRMQQATPGTRAELSQHQSSACQELVNQLLRSVSSTLTCSLAKSKNGQRRHRSLRQIRRTMRLLHHPTEAWKTPPERQESGLLLPFLELAPKTNTTNTKFQATGSSRHIVDTNVSHATRQITIVPSCRQNQSVSSIGETPLSSSMCGQHTSCLTEVKLVDVEKIARRKESNCLQMSLMHPWWAARCWNVQHRNLNDPCHQHFPDRQTWKKIFDQARSNPGHAWQLRRQCSSTTHHNTLKRLKACYSSHHLTNLLLLCRCGRFSFKPLPEWADQVDWPKPAGAPQ